MFQAQNRETMNSTWKVAVSFQDHYDDDERDKTVFHNTKPDLQDQNHSVQDQDHKRPIFWSQTGLVLRPTVSDHITAIYNNNSNSFLHIVYRRTEKTIPLVECKSGFQTCDCTLFVRVVGSSTLLHGMMNRLHSCYTTTNYVDYISVLRFSQMGILSLTEVL